MNYKKLFITLCAVALIFIAFPLVLLFSASQFDVRLITPSLTVGSVCLLVALSISKKF